MDAKGVPVNGNALRLAMREGCRTWALGLTRHQRAGVLNVLRWGGNLTSRFYPYSPIVIALTPLRFPFFKNYLGTYAESHGFQAFRDW